jgi:uncharacterized membrane protein
MSEIPPPTVPPSIPPPPGGGSYLPPPPPPLPPSGASGPGTSSDRTIMLVLSYLGLLALIPLLMKKDDSEVQWHAKNGLALMVAEIVLWIILQVILHVLPAVVSCGLALVSCVIWIGFLVVAIMGIMKALKGERLRVPIISDFADKM